ncbi:hypothetical protein AF333_16940 [Aneurinibacillus migulanus]|uniref:Uncharacterized protein n=1 Tax=Aneurinibacillus migulanus TaxID=47500 RepID=A0A0M0H496_ANEMI|nr:hypothetical protein AF333_16940 [Aneurinibacillus migulanus]
MVLFCFRRERYARNVSKDAPEDVKKIVAEALHITHKERLGKRDVKYSSYIYLVCLLVEGLLRLLLLSWFSRIATNRIE